jgi:hypothetical protein
LADVVDIDHEHGDAGENEDVCGEDPDAWYLAGPVTFVRDLTEREDRVDGGGNEQPDCDLTWLVSQDSLGENWPIAS